MRTRSFSAKYPPDHEGPRYGRLFRMVRTCPCWLKSVGYQGPGHQRCGPGVQGGHTAHHIGRQDAEGLIPGCGAAHDLYAGYGGRTTVLAFREFMDRMGWTLDGIGRGYVETFALASESDGA